jgi:hypothetical protein
LARCLFRAEAKTAIAINPAEQWVSVTVNDLQGAIGLCHLQEAAFSTLNSTAAREFAQVLVAAGPGGTPRIASSDVRYRQPRYLRDRKSINGREPVEVKIKGCEGQHKKTANDNSPAQG